MSPLLLSRTGLPVLDRQLELVRNTWPLDELDLAGGTGRAFDLAISEAQDRIARFKHETAANPEHSLKVSVSPYGRDCFTTFIFGRAHLRAAVGARNYVEKLDNVFRKLKAEDCRYRPGTPDFKNCLRIEVIDVRAHISAPDREVHVKEVCGANSAHMAVIYAAAQDTLWAMSINAYDIPDVLIGGIEINAPIVGGWGSVLLLEKRADCLTVDGYHKTGHLHASAPTLWP